MKVNLELLKIITRLLILLILFVMLFMISTFLYSAKYWPDVYTYLNANITIRRIPTLSELNVTLIVKEEIEREDYTTEGYITTDGEFTDVTGTFDTTDDLSDSPDEFFSKRSKRFVKLEEMNGDYSELPRHEIIYYAFNYIQEIITAEVITTEVPRITDKQIATEEVIVTEIPNTTERPNTNEKTITAEKAKTSGETIITENRIDTIPKEEAIGTKKIIPTEQRIATEEGITTMNAKATEETLTNEEEITTRKQMAFKKPITVEESVTTEKAKTTEIMDDSIDESKLTTRYSNDVEMIPKRINNNIYFSFPDWSDEDSELEKRSTTRSKNESTNPTDIFPWIAAIFVKNGGNNQFEYYCDGALLSNSLVLTAARCVTASNATDADDVIIILGKHSLQSARDDEIVQKVKNIIRHDNFSINGDLVKNDLALLVLEDPVPFGSSIHPAYLPGFEIGKEKESLTTGWAVSGELTPIRFDKDKSKQCRKQNENTFCATYGNDVSVCPSFGGVYVSRADEGWQLQGIRTDDATHRSFCIDKTVHYTSLSDHLKWIVQRIDMNKY